ncbi:MAG: hypothetical protein KH054_12710 [Firmicutes bacterium]|nr:hypothetical protein [Bacillota bacterium]
MIEPIKTEKPEQIIYAPVIKPKKNINAFVNGVLISTAVSIFLAMLATYFVTLCFDGEIGVKDFSVNCVWLMVGSYSLGTVTKKIATNKAHMTEGFTEVRELADKKLKELRAQGYGARIAEYCRNYEITEQNNVRKVICLNYNLDFSAYVEKYAGKTLREIRAQYPNDLLTDGQKKAIRKANKVKIHHYDPDFLRWEETAKGYRSPSEAYRADVANKINSVNSIVKNIISSLFACSIGVDLLMNFNKQTVIMALIKVAFIIINVANKFIFAWQNTTVTECNRYRLKASEADNFLDWCKANPPKTEESKEENV